MNLRRVWVVIILVFWLTGCAIPKPTVQQSQPESNYGFVFKYGSCTTDILDTFKGTFTKDMIVEPAVSTAFQLSDDQMKAIYQKMAEIDFFSYPEVFTVPIPKHGSVGIITPSTRYEITVRNGDLTKTLSWQDEIIDPTTPKADHLRKLFQLIIGMIQENLDYQKLPERTAGCV